MLEKTCSTCQCNKVCDHNKYGFENCGNYISADLILRAEAVTQILAELESIAMSKLDAGLSVAQLDDTYYIQAIDDLKEKYSVVAPPANLVSLEDVSKAIKDYCCELIDQGKDAVEVTEFNADLQSILSKNRRKA